MAFPAKQTSQPARIKVCARGIQRVVCPKPQSNGAIKIFFLLLKIWAIYISLHNYYEERDMKSKLLILTGFLFLLTIGLQSCAVKKGCGCGNNLNYYKPKKFKK